MGRVLLCLVATLLWSSPSAALTFSFGSGSAQITVTRTSDNSQVAAFNVALDGDFIEFDTVGGTLDDLLITTGASGPVTMDQVWGGFDIFQIESASISPGIGYSSLFDSMTGPTSYAFVVGPLDIDGFYSASFSGGPPPAPVTNIPVPGTTGATLLNGTIDTDTVQLDLIGVTLAQIPGAGFGESDDLVVKADLTWFGAVPEPSTGLMFAVGLGWLATRRPSARVH